MVFLNSMGPSAFVLKSADIINNQKQQGLINTIKLLDFDLDHIMAQNAQGWLSFGYGWEGNLQYNYSGGTYNAEDGIIYLSLPGTDIAQHFYNPPPVIIALQIIPQVF